MHQTSPRQKQSPAALAAKKAFPVFPVSTKTVIPHFSASTCTSVSALPVWKTPTVSIPSCPTPKASVWHRKMGKGLFVLRTAPNTPTAPKAPTAEPSMVTEMYAYRKLANVNAQHGPLKMPVSPNAPPVTSTEAAPVFENVQRTDLPHATRISPPLKPATASMTTATAPPTRLFLSKAKAAMVKIPISAKTVQSHAKKVH